MKFATKRNPHINETGAIALILCMTLVLAGSIVVDLDTSIPSKVQPTHVASQCTWPRA